jgi:hypothetical protein
MKAEKTRLNHGLTQMRTDFIKLIPGSAGILPASASIQSAATGRQDAGAPGLGCGRAALPLFPFTLALGKTVWNTN